MIAHRIVRADRTSLEGKGAAENPGRWNTEGVPCLYSSSTPALAQLEVMVNAEDWKIFITVKHVVLHISFPADRLLAVGDSDLPARWADAVYGRKTQELGSDLLNNPGILAFSIPSAVSKTERNFILNPRAVDFGKLVKVEEALPFEFDSRLLKA